MNGEYLLLIIVVITFLFIGLIIGLLNLRDYLSDNNVSWLQAKYSIIPYHDNFQYNFNGKVVSYDEYYIIRRKIPFFFCTTYVDCDYEPNIHFRKNNYSATRFKNKLEARKKLKDMFSNPDKYRMCRN